MKGDEIGEVKVRQATQEEIDRYFKHVHPLRGKVPTFADNAFLREHDVIDRSGVRHVKTGGRSHA